LSKIGILNLQGCKNDTLKIMRSIVYSIKLSRDTAYLEKMKYIIKTQNLPLIFVTCDTILAYRCILNNLSVIYTIGKLIKFISINKNNVNYYIENPFSYLPSSTLDINLIKQIIEKPNLKITNNLKFTQKYVLINQEIKNLYQNIYQNFK